MDPLGWAGILYLQSPDEAPTDRLMSTRKYGVCLWNCVNYAADFLLLWEEVVRI